MSPQWAKSTVQLGLLNCNNTGTGKGERGVGGVARKKSQWWMLGPENITWQRGSLTNSWEWTASKRFSFYYIPPASDPKVLRLTLGTSGEPKVLQLSTSFPILTYFRGNTFSLKLATPNIAIIIGPDCTECIFDGISSIHADKSLPLSFPAG